MTGLNEDKENNASEASRKAAMDAMNQIVDILGPLSSDERGRVISAAMMMLGDASMSARPAPAQLSAPDDSEISDLPVRAKTWMRQHSVSQEQIQQVFHKDGEAVDVIAAHIPGRSKKEQTYNAYILTGLARLLSSGNATFDDKTARTLCESAGCYDPANHAAYMKNKGNEFSGNKEKGWTLTAPGLQRAAALVKDLGA